MRGNTLASNGLQVVRRKATERTREGARHVNQRAGKGHDIMRTMKMHTRHRARHSFYTTHASIQDNDEANLRG